MFNDDKPRKRIKRRGEDPRLDALASDLPIVTLPGACMLTRQRAEMLELAGLPEVVAARVDDYLMIAPRLASDPGWRSAMSAKIRAGSGRLFDDPAPIAGLAQFIRDAHSRARQSATAPSGG